MPSIYLRCVRIHFEINNKTLFETQVMCLMPLSNGPPARYNTRFYGAYHHSEVLYHKG
jgi:hypothetical protein